LNVELHDFYVHNLLLFIKMLTCLQFHKQVNIFINIVLKNNYQIDKTLIKFKIRN